MTRVKALAAVCAAHGVPLAAAALQFPLAHPAVACVLAGMADAAQVAANSLAIPAAVLALGDVVLLLSAVVDAGVTLGAKHINPPAATNAATTTANLDLAKNHVLFSSATDAVTAATVSLLVAKRADVMSYLSAQATLL